MMEDGISRHMKRGLLAAMMCFMMLIAVPGGPMMMATAEDTHPSTIDPGEWCWVKAWGFERTEQITLEITQNGMTRTTTWAKDDWEDMGGMSTASKGGGGGEEKIYGIWAAGDDFTYLKRWDGDNASLVSFEEVTDKTMNIYFLVSEVSGENITVKVSGTRGGTSDSATFVIGTEPMESASMGLTYSRGGWKLKWVGPNEEQGTWQGEYIHIYGIGLAGTVRLTISNDQGVVKTVDLTAEDHLVHYKWDVPKDTPLGMYKATLAGTDHNGKQVELEGEFYVADLLVSLSPPVAIMPDLMWVPIPVVFGIMLGVLLFSRIKRQNVLNNIARARIHQHIKNNPGVHFRAIQKDLNLKLGSVSHHINVLEREEAVRSYQDGVHRRFYLAGTRPPLKVMLSKLQESILNTVKENPGITQSKISKQVGKSRFVVNYHVKILSDVGMLSVEKDGRKSHCYVTG